MRTFAALDRWLRAADEGTSGPFHAMMVVLVFWVGVLAVAVLLVLVF